VTFGERNGICRYYGCGCNLRADQVDGVLGRLHGGPVGAMGGCKGVWEGEGMVAGARENRLLPRATSPPSPPSTRRPGDIGMAVYAVILHLPCPTPTVFDAVMPAIPHGKAKRTKRKQILVRVCQSDQRWTGHRLAPPLPRAPCLIGTSTWRRRRPIVPSPDVGRSI